MVDAYSSPQAQNIRAQTRLAGLTWWVMYLAVLAVSVTVNALMLRGEPSLPLLVWLFYVAGIVAIFYKPRIGVYLLVGLTLFGDASLTDWYPFTKNLSSIESLLYVNDALIISPLETYIVLIAVSWFGRMAMERRISLHTGILFWPAVLFLIFVSYGLVFGLSRGGNLVIALWEARSIYYMLSLLVLVSNLIQTRSQVNILFWVIVSALFLKGLTGVSYIATELQWDISGVERIAEHSMSIQFNLFFVLTIAAWVYRDSLPRRLLLPLMLPPILLSFFANHRRASFLTLGVAALLILLLLYRERRRLFWALAPAGTLSFLVYMVAFWNNNSALGIMARSVRSVIGRPTLRDAASNIYRDIENANIMFTIKQVPLQGVGFGQQFFIVYQMPDISSFEWWQYITHNSIMWVWMKTGVGGFYAMLLLVGLALALGGRMILTIPRGPMRAYALVATLYLLMHFLYAYADMSWDTRSMVLVGTMLGLLNSLEQIVAKPLSQPERRWPWQLETVGERGSP